MSKNVLIISTSLHVRSNSEEMAKSCLQGALDAGHKVEYVSLKGKKIEFCRGCMICHQKGQCAIKDDAIEIEQKLMKADVVVWASPIYYFEMTGQMKTLIDRMNSMYTKDYPFRDVYFLSCAAETEPEVPDRAIKGLTGWIDCYPKSRLAGTVFCGGMEEAGDILTKGADALKKCYELGKNL